MIIFLNHFRSKIVYGDIYAVQKILLRRDIVKLKLQESIFLLVFFFFFLIYYFNEQFSDSQTGQVLCSSKC